MLTTTFYQFIRPKLLLYASKRGFHGDVDRRGSRSEYGLGLGVPFDDLPIVDSCPICIRSTHLYLVQVRDELVLWNCNTESDHGELFSTWDYRTLTGKKSELSGSVLR